MSLKFSIPVISERVEVPNSPKEYRLAPVFSAGGSVDDSTFILTNTREDRALKKLTDIIRKHLSRIALEMRHDELIRWQFSPECRIEKIGLGISLRKQSVSGDFLFILLTAFDRRVVLFPRIPGFTFDLERGDSLGVRAQEVLQKHFRRLEKNGTGKLDLDQYLTPGYTRLERIEVTIRSRQRFPDSPEANFASFFTKEEVSGAAELERVGRQLNLLYPRDLHEAILRDGEVQSLQSHFQTNKRDIPPPCSLVGPGQVGKTAIIHQFVRNLIGKKGVEAGKKVPEVWLISPPRVISGMIHVGEWQERAKAIFDHAAERKHILYFDDLPGLFEAGRSANSDLTLGQVLKARMEKGDLRILAETTPEAWRKLRELNRGFADLFKTIPVREPDARDTMRILIRCMQGYEGENPKLQFRPSLLRSIYHLQERFARGRAFPGKAVELLRQVASQPLPENGEPVGTDAVYDLYARKTGIRGEFLRTGDSISTESVEAFFTSRIKGQKAAVSAMSDVVIRCIAQLNEPGKPLGSLLFLGPTGVGKTESVKALGEYFFGRADRLARFDMNEFVGPDAVDRLIGTRHRPNGLLTGRIRRQPFSIVLLDEIEKAHPAVFDLLLQLLGDGRLTDASGRTTDFSNCVVVMTSNLGARSSKQQLGFGALESDEAALFREAAEKFFRPELFNRLDHIIAFHELKKEDIEALVAVMSSKALNRIGLTGRRIHLQVESSVHRKLAELGFRPEYGARALRRAVEEFLIEPIATRMSSLPANRPAKVICGVGTDGNLDFQVNSISARPPSGWRPREFSLPDAEEFADTMGQFFGRMEDRLDSLRDTDEDGTIDPGSTEQATYFALRDLLTDLREARDKFLAMIEREKRAQLDNRGKRVSQTKRYALRLLGDFDGESLLEECYASTSPLAFVRELLEKSEPLESLSDYAAELIGRMAHFENSISQTPPSLFGIRISSSGGPETIIPCHTSFSNWWKDLADGRAESAYRDWKGDDTLAIASRQSTDEFLRSGSVPEKLAIIGKIAGVTEILQTIEGSQLCISSGDRIEQWSLALTAPEDAGESALEYFARTESIPDSPLSHRVASIDCHSIPLRIDLATGIISHPDSLLPLIRHQLPVPEEFLGFVVLL